MHRHLQIVAHAAYSSRRNLTGSPKVPPKIYIVRTDEHLVNNDHELYEDALADELLFLLTGTTVSMSSLGHFSLAHWISPTSLVWAVQPLSAGGSDTPRPCIFTHTSEDAHAKLSYKFNLCPIFDSMSPENPLRVKLVDDTPPTRTERLYEMVLGGRGVKRDGTLTEELQRPYVDLPDCHQQSTPASL